MNNNFRKDLYFRLKTVCIDVPSLNEHTDDIPELVDRFGLEFMLKMILPTKVLNETLLKL